MYMSVKTTVSVQDIEEAFLRLKDIVKETPLQKDHYLSQKYNCNVYLKREDLQWVRSFKLRGAYNAIDVLPDQDKRKGVTCASAGNHAQGVAFTAKYCLNPGAQLKASKNARMLSIMPFAS